MTLSAIGPQSPDARSRNNPLNPCEHGTLDPDTGRFPPAGVENGGETISQRWRYGSPGSTSPGSSEDGQELRLVGARQQRSQQIDRVGMALAAAGHPSQVIPHSFPARSAR